MAGTDGRRDECVVRLMMEDILAYLRLLSGQKDAWYLQTHESGELGVCSFCNFDRVHVHVGVFIIVCVAEKLGYNSFLFVSCFLTPAGLLLYYVFLLFIILSGFSMLM